MVAMVVIVMVARAYRYIRIIRREVRIIAAPAVVWSPRIPGIAPVIWIVPIW